VNSHESVFLIFGAGPRSLAYLFRREVSIRLREIHARDVTSFGGESRHDGRAEFVIAACDDRNFVLESHSCAIVLAANRRISTGHKFS